MAKLFAIKFKATGNYFGGTSGKPEQARKWSHRTEAQAEIDMLPSVMGKDYEVVEIDPTWLDRRQAELHAAMMSERDAAKTERWHTIYAVKSGNTPGAEFHYEVETLDEVPTDDGLARVVIHTDGMYPTAKDAEAAGVAWAYENRCLISQVVPFMEVTP